ncbi:hypothetical protein ATANTOWER_013881 [Ataeniobius toweri]|uniref:Uncharacterized protein n=1 Tax=Ataeniobius toweri TaxID=208326 RepID=A0ABU7ARG3_9TELE|nr:hypothetical protein [Ataeniobius toweri]
MIQQSRSTENCLNLISGRLIGPSLIIIKLCSVFPGRFWHITDLHLDPTYHLTQDPTKVCFSSKGAPATHAGLYGDFLCDSPYSLIQSAFANMAPLTQPQDFIIWTGSVQRVQVTPIDGGKIGFMM